MTLVKTAIGCFNSRDGIGLFSGPARYNVLEERIMLCAVQAQSLTEFWGILCRKMLWPTPPKRMDEEILSQLSVEPEEGMQALRAIAKEPASIVMLARYLADQEKAPSLQRRELEEEWRAIDEGRNLGGEEKLDV